MAVSMARRCLSHRWAVVRCEVRCRRVNGRDPPASPGVIPRVTWGKDGDGDDLCSLSSNVIGNAVSGTTSKGCEPFSRFSFYVEAKQYVAVAPGYLLKGMQQIWNMLDELRGTSLDVSEAFYVVYRRGGPRYSFEPRVQHRERVSTS